jgi:hypothetical protein
MTGKIFPESGNIYQDQARVLFDFYKQAAETIVAEEERLEKEMAVANEQATQLQNEVVRQKSKETAFYIGAGVAFVIGVICFVLGISFLGFVGVAGGIGLAVVAIGEMSKRKKNEASRQDITTRIAGFTQAHAAIRRDYRVHKLGIAYVQVAAQIPFEGKSFLVDFSDTVQAQGFQLCTVRESELFSHTINELDEMMTRLPVVESASHLVAVPTDQYSRSIQEVPYYDYMGDMDRKLKTVTRCMENLDRNSVALPVIFPNSDYARFLADFGTTQTGNTPLLSPFAADQYDEQLAKFESLNQMKKVIERHSSQFEEVLRRMMGNIAATVQALTMVKMASSNQLVESSNRLLFNILKAPYNHYSPKLESDEIDRIRNETFDFQESVESYKPFALKQSSRVRFDLSMDTWVAEDGSRTSYPFGMLQIEEEIIAPIVQNLMQETRIERMKIYHNIKDQKIDYLNQWHRDTEDFYGRNRAESQDIVNQMRATFTEFVAAHNQLSSYEKAERNMSKSGSLKDAVVSAESGGAEMVSAYDLKAREFRAVQEEFGDYMDRLKDDIDRRAEKFGYVEFFDISLRDGHARAFAQSVSNAGGLDDRRKALLGVNPFYAEVSELAPAPSVEEVAREHFSINLNAVARNVLAELDGTAGGAPVQG